MRMAPVGVRASEHWKTGRYACSGNYDKCILGNFAGPFIGIWDSYHRLSSTDGSYLENTELEPDIKVANSPETIVKGEDTQLKMAVDELLKEIDSRKK